MAVRLPGTIGLMLRRFTPEFRYDNGIAGGHIMFGVWAYPEDVGSDREIISIVNRRVAAPPLDAVVFMTLRIEGAVVGSGTVTVILQSTAFGFCTVRRSVAGTLVANQWQRIEVVCATSIIDCHLYVDGVEVTYAFSRSEIGLPPHGGSDVLFGSTFRGLDGGPAYQAGSRLVNGDLTNGDVTKRFTTAPGTFFKGRLQHPGFWHAGILTATGMIQALADGFSPTFLNHFLENSTVSKGLLMAPALYGDGEPAGSVYDPEQERDPVSGIKLEYTSGAGACTWADGPGVCEPVPPDTDGPGPEVERFPRLCLPFGLPRAEIYSNPGNPADLLPIVYGDFRVGGLRGPVPATLIDKGTDSLGPWVYCAAFHPVVSIDGVYIDDVLQTTGFTVNLSNNFQNRSAIATITFTVQPEGPVSWRGRGLYDSTGLVVMENCIDQLVHLLTTWGNFDLDEDFDLTAHAEARAAVETLGYKTAFVIYDLAVTQDWLTEMLFNVMGYWRINGKQQVELHVDSGQAFTLADVGATVLAARDCVHGDDGVAVVLDRQYLVNAITAYYLWSYSLGAPTSRLVGDGMKDFTSIHAYGEMAKAVTLKGLRRQVDVETWAEILLARQSGRTRVEGALVAFTLLRGRHAHLSIGDYIAFTWPYGPTREGGNPYTNEILRIVSLAVDAAQGGAYQVQAVDLGAYLTDGTGARQLDLAHT